MLFDTDVLVWALRGNLRAAHAINDSGMPEVSVVTYLELIQGAYNKRRLTSMRTYLKNLKFRIIPLSENIGHRASVYMEEYALSTGIGMSDALIAATAIEAGLRLCTGNAKHYRAIADIELQIFRHK